MKKIVLLIILACVCTAASARQFCEEGKTWRYAIRLNRELCYDAFYEMRGDTIINSYACKKLYLKNSDTFYRFEYTAGLYEDEKGDVYAIQKGERTPQILYRFSAKEGCEFDQELWCGGEWMGYDIIGASLTSITQNSEGLNEYDWLINLKWDEDSMTSGTTWVEAVGSIFYPFLPFHLTSNSWILVTCKVGNDLVYGHPQYKDYPLPPDPLVEQDGVTFEVDYKECTASPFMKHTRSAKSLEVPHSINIDGKEYTVGLDTYSFYNCHGLESLTIADGITQTATQCILSCESLRKIVLPKTLKSIKYSSFKNCPSIEEIYCYAEEVPEGAEHLIECIDTQKAVLYVPESAVEAYKGQLTGLTILPIESSGIASLHSDSALPAPTYSLDGRKANTSDGRGLHIKDGKVTLIH